jgi:hypothetical protein
MLDNSYQEQTEFVPSSKNLLKEKLKKKLAAIALSIGLTTSPGSPATPEVQTEIRPKTPQQPNQT